MTALTDPPHVLLPDGSAMPLLGFGTWQLRGEDARMGVRAALEAGYRHIDTATAYENEAEIGRALAESGVARDEVFITTKVAPDRFDRATETLRASLDNLGVEQVDLWLIHWPADDDASPQTWQKLLEARDAGLARNVGVSNYSVKQIDELVAATGETPAVNQIPWAPALFDEQLLRDSRSRGVVVEGYSPFRLTDLEDPALVEIAEVHGVTPAQVVLRWHVQHEVVVIPKSARPERIASNLDVFGFELSAEQMRRVDSLKG